MQPCIRACVIRLLWLATRTTCACLLTNCMGNVLAHLWLRLHRKWRKYCCDFRFDFIFPLKSSNYGVHENVYHAQLEMFRFPFSCRRNWRRRRREKNLAFDSLLFCGLAFSTHTQTCRRLGGCTLHFVAGDAKWWIQRNVDMDFGPVDRLDELHSCKWHIIRWLWRQPPQTVSSHKKKYILCVHSFDAARCTQKSISI